MSALDMTSRPSSSGRDRHRSTCRVLPLLGASLLLASCGGSDDGTPPTVIPVVSNQPPASASASTDGFIAFLKTVVVTMPDTTTPLDVAAFVAPTSDTTLPDPTI